ncbi:MAG: polyamine aminopropyltransferase [Myxococcota bacterium]|nr:polyamine aminopropyltransferase [Myxococcota bacterium]
MNQPLWFDEVYEDNSRLGLKVKRILFEGRSQFQQIDVLDTAAYGRVLAIDKIFMTSERDEHFYHEMIVHPALTTAENIKRVLVIGGGDGGTVREVLSYPDVEHVTMVEIDRKVVEISKQFLPSIGTAWDDPRLNIQFRDGIDYAKNPASPLFDVILLDGCDPVGPAKGLFSQAFYEGCARLLTKGGVFALQSESPFLMQHIFLEIQQTLSRIFTHALPYFGSVPIYNSGIWSWTYASQSTTPHEPDMDRVRLQEARCKYYNRDIHRAAFAMPNDLKKLLTG